MTDVSSEVAAQAAAQAAQQAAQQAGQAAAETVRQVIDATRTARAQEVGAESEFETGSDEFWKAQSQLNAINAKRTYDEYQHESLAHIRENRQIVDRMAQLSVDHDSQIRNISLQALQNAVESANMLSKQAVAHRDIAIDREWNVDEVSTLTAKSGLQADLAAAIATAVVAGMVEAKKQGAL